MGLTIHYGLTAPETNLDKVRSLVRSFHALAKQLPFQEVEDVVEFQGKACGYDNADDSDRWLKI